MKKDTIGEMPSFITINPKAQEKRLRSIKMLVNLLNGQTRRRHPKKRVQPNFYITIGLVATLIVVLIVLLMKSDLKQDKPNKKAVAIVSSERVSQCEFDEEIFEMIEEPYYAGPILYGEINDYESTAVEWKVLSYPDDDRFFHGLNVGDRLCVKRADKRINAFHIKSVLK